ncbi:MAG: alpha-L-rhamnosidase C-terminal domain-containing protein [Saccharofermentanales bacterium]
MIDFKNSYDLTPKSKECYGIKIKDSLNCENAGNILDNTETAAKLINKSDDAKAFVVMDLSKSSPGGYPVFKVKSFDGEPVIRIMYHDRYDTLRNPINRQVGDFPRGTCKYLGIELPVMPANPGRFETYTISRTGEYMFPLIQGQQRFVMIELQTPDSAVEIEYFYIYYTADMSELKGAFECSDDKLTKLWYISAYTLQLATIKADQWEIVNDKLLLRALTKGNPCGIHKYYPELTDYTFSFDFFISVNPDMVSGIGAAIRCKNNQNGYVVNLDLDGTLSSYVRVDGVLKSLVSQKNIGRIVDNQIYRMSISAIDNVIAVVIDGIEVDRFTDDTFDKGSFGFCQTPEKWAAVLNVRIDADEEMVFFDNFQNGLLDEYNVYQGKPFVADGGKRDRLPWSGDLDWAGRNSYYSSGDYAAMANTIKMYADKQTPEGYMWAAFYPEDEKRPDFGEWGYYESDLFSAWMIPTIADYLLYTNDLKTVKFMYKSIVRNLDYLWRFVEADGLFNQRYETSKGLWDHNLGDMGKLTYTNIVIWDSFNEGAFIAEELGYPQEAKIFKDRAYKMKSGILKHLYDKEKGYFVKGYKLRDFCYMANSEGLAACIFSDEQAKTLSEKISDFLSDHGKILSLTIRGLYQYGFAKQAYTLFTGRNKMPYKTEKETYICWYDICDSDEFPHTTSECMHFPDFANSIGHNWGDLSHPDTAVAHILTGQILGVLPVKPGFKEFTIIPNLYNIDFAKGRIPVPGGDSIEVSVEKSDGGMKLIAVVPAGLKFTVKLPATKENLVMVNGKASSDFVVEGDKVVFGNLDSGEYEIELK